MWLEKKLIDPCIMWLENKLHDVGGIIDPDEILKARPGFLPPPPLALAETRVRRRMEREWKERKNVPIQSTAILELSPIPNQIINNGTNAGTGK